jgi:hypothetical protein
MNNNTAQLPQPPRQPASNAPPAASTGGAAPVTSVNGYRLPEVVTLQHAARLSIVEDKPVMFDYWTNSLDKTVLIGVKDDTENKEKLLVKTEEEYTSPIAKIYKVGSEYIVVTENSIYIVDVNIPTKRISNQFA